MKKIVEQRTAFGTEYVEYKKEKNSYYNKTMIFYRKSWGRLPRGKWIPTGISDEKKFLEKIGTKYKTKKEWDKIQQKQSDVTKKNIPNIVKLEEIDKEIRLLEGKMVNAKINSLTDKQKLKYNKLLKARRGINII